MRTPSGDTSTFMVRRKSGILVSRLASAASGCARPTLFDFLRHSELGPKSRLYLARCRKVRRQSPLAHPIRPNNERLGVPPGNRPPAPFSLQSGYVPELDKTAFPSPAVGPSRNSETPPQRPCHRSL